MNLSVAKSLKHDKHTSQPLMAMTEENVAVVEKVREDPQLGLKVILGCMKISSLCV